MGNDSLYFFNQSHLETFSFQPCLEEVLVSLVVFAVL